MSKRIDLYIPLCTEPHGSIDPLLVHLIEVNYKFERRHSDGLPYYYVAEGFTLRHRQETTDHQIVDILNPSGELVLTVHRYISSYTSDRTVIVKK